MPRLPPRQPPPLLHLVCPCCYGDAQLPVASWRVCSAGVNGMSGGVSGLEWGRPPLTPGPSGCMDSNWLCRLAKHHLIAGMV